MRSLLNKIFTLSIFVALVLSPLLAYDFKDFQAVLATPTVSPNGQLMPLDFKERVETGLSQNMTVENSSNIVIDNSQDKPEDCEMPPCPPGHACIQRCP